MAENIAKGLGRGVEIAEEVRDTRSADNLFAGIFYGKPPLNDVFRPWPKPSGQEANELDRLLEKIKQFLVDKVDLYEIDDKATVPLEVFEGMTELGLWGLKAPKEYGGLGLSNTSYIDILTLLASWGSAPVIAVSAHNTIGCVFPVMYYGTQEQKERLLPELIKWPTGFCLTEKDAGSDASNIKECAVRVKDDNGKVVGYRVSYQKYFTTNGILSDGVPLAKYLAVIARIVDHPDDLDNKSNKECFGLFIIPTDSKGFDVGTRNQFVAMRGIHNSNPRFTDVYVSVLNLIGEKRPDWEEKYGWSEREGSGLKIAFESLNGGRISIAKGCIGASKQAFNILRWWAVKRSQLGGPLAEKEMIRDKIMNAAAGILAMEAMSRYASLCFDNGQDVRIEAAAAKTFASEMAWYIVDEMAQTRGGRYYETWQTLSKRELTPPDEAIWAGARPNRIFEGANEILVQLIFREGTDKYIKTAMPFMTKSSMTAKLRAAYKLGRYSGIVATPDWTYNLMAHAIPSHSEFVRISSKRLARKILISSGKYQKKLALKQLMLDRFSRISIYLGAMVLTSSYAQQLDQENPGHDFNQLADVFCRSMRTKVEILFRELNNNDDEYRWKVSKRVVDGEFDEFLLRGIIPMTEEYMRGPED